MSIVVLSFQIGMDRCQVGQTEGQKSVLFITQISLAQLSTIRRPNFIW
jgi:hypothetical protein